MKQRETEEELFNCPIIYCEKPNRVRLNYLASILSEYL